MILVENWRNPSNSAASCSSWRRFAPQIKLGKEASFVFWLLCKIKVYPVMLCLTLQIVKVHILGSLDISHTEHIQYLKELLIVRKLFVILCHVFIFGGKISLLVFPVLLTTASRSCFLCNIDKTH